MNFHIHRVVAAAAALAFGAAAPAIASTDPLTPNGGGKPVQSDATSAAQIDRLQQLRSSQTPAQAAKIMSGPNGVGLYDTATGRWVAAYKQPATVSPFALHSRGPGCATGDACARAGSTPYGWYGTGVLHNLGIASVNKVSAGDHNTTFWYSATEGINLKVKGTAYPASAFTLTDLTRS